MKSFLVKIWLLVFNDFQIMKLRKLPTLLIANCFDKKLALLMKYWNKLVTLKKIEINYRVKWNSFKLECFFRNLLGFSYQTICFYNYRMLNVFAQFFDLQEMRRWDKRNIFVPFLRLKLLCKVYHQRDYLLFSWVFTWQWNLIIIFIRDVLSR